MVDGASTQNLEVAQAAGRTTRSVRWLASRWLWIAAALLIVIAITLSLVFPAHRRLQALQYLDVREIEYEFSADDEWLTERFGERGSAFRNVERIEAQGVTNKDLLQIAQFREVKYLHCALDWPSSPIDHQSIVALEELSRLEGLSLSGEEITDDAFAEVLANRPPLTGLGLHGTSAASRTLRELEHFPSITYLVLNGKFPEDADFRDSSPPPHLQSLFLWGGQRGDVAAKWASGAGELVSLQIAYCQLTDDGLSELSGLQHLEWLYLYECPNLTVAGLTSLESHPKLRHIGIPGELIVPQTLEILERLPDLESVRHSGTAEDAEVLRQIEETWPANRN